MPNQRSYLSRSRFPGDEELEPPSVLIVDDLAEDSLPVGPPVSRIATPNRPVRSPVTPYPTADG